MGKLLNFIITVLIILFFVGIAMTLFKSSSFLNEQVGKVKDGASTVTQKAASVGQSITQTSEKAINKIVDEGKEIVTEGKEMASNIGQEGQTETGDAGKSETIKDDTDIEDAYEDGAEASAKAEIAAEMEAKKAKAVAEAKKDIPQEYSTIEKNNTTAKSPTTAGVSSKAPYLVITGSFMQKANAESEVNRLKEMGYAKAEAVYLGSTKYLSVIADRFVSNKEALKAVERIKKDGVEAYVHKRKEKK